MSVHLYYLCVCTRDNMFMCIFECVMITRVFFSWSNRVFIDRKQCQYFVIAFVITKKKKTRVWIYDNNKYRFGRFVSSKNRPAALRYNAVYLTTNNCRFFVLYKIYYVRVMAFCREQQLLGRPFWPRTSFGIRHSYASRLNIVITCRAVEARFFFLAIARKSAINTNLTYHHDRTTVVAYNVKRQSRAVFFFAPHTTFLPI